MAGVRKPIPSAKLTTEAEAERNRFYSGARWRRLRAAFLRKNPLCQRCQAAGRIVAADTVHHKVERLEDPSKSYRWSNLEAICPSCHATHHKTKARAFYL